MSGNNESQTFIDRVVGFSLASWINCIISVIATPITTAVFPPVEMGKISLFISYANILVPFVYMGFDQAYTRFYNEPCGKNDKYSLFRLCSIITLSLGIIAGIVVLFGWKYFSTSIIGYPDIWISLALIVYVIASLLYRLCSLKSRMENKVKKFCVLSVLSTIIIKISFVIVVVVRPSAEYAIYVRALFLMLAFGLFFLKDWNECKTTGIDYSKPVLKELTSFSLPIFPTAFLVMLNMSLAQIMLRRYEDFAQMGIYANAVTIAALISVVQSGLNAFWTPFVYEYYKDQHKVQTMHHIFSVLMFLMAFIIIAGQDVIYFFLVDERYWESKAILAILVISPVCDVLAETLGLGIELSKKTYLKLPAYIINVLVNLVSCVVLIPLLGILGAAIANALASISMLVARAVIGEHFYRCSDNYLKLILSMILLLVAGCVNYTYHTYIYLYVLVALSIVVYIYKKEVTIISRQGMAYINKRIKL